MVPANDPEFKSIKFTMDKMSLSDKELGIKVRESLKRPFLLVIEYIPGFSLSNCKGDRSLMVFHPDVAKGFAPDSVPYPPPKVEGNSYDQNSTFKESPLITLGKILGSDIILNNSDRFPTISAGTGNTGNLFFEV
jgi:hypothetical protein